MSGIFSVNRVIEVSLAVVGLILITSLIWWLLRRRRNRGRSANRSLDVPVVEKGYKPLETDHNAPRDLKEVHNV